ncbi:MAG TPA: carbamoyltransferase C-terminal domain-containing protein [Burkholderiaceae bacterium]|nr:carbamoyltransferase C-terminal domain-containing protein [Burkholderiaceae bacterium]
MITLGINAAFHDSSAALVVDGAVLAAAEEERFSRIKHSKRPLPFSAWELPFNAIDFCLKQAGVGLVEVDHVAYSFEPRAFLGTRADQDSLTLPLQPSAQPAADWENPWDPLFGAYVVNAPRLLVDSVPHHLKKRFGGIDSRKPPFRWHFVNHHVCHQASACLAAPFDRCAVMTLDGRGERATTSYGVYRDGGYRALGQVRMPDSLGLLYERVTSHLGFLHSSDEYKVMALAALGKPTRAEALRQHVRLFGSGQYRIDPFELERVFGPARERGGPLEERHLDAAASLQRVLEDTVLSLARWLREECGEPLLAMAGGVALNCVMNSCLRDSAVFDQVWVQPAAGDAGTSLGAALWVDARERAAGLDIDSLAVNVPVVRPAEDNAHRVSEGAVVALGARRWQMDHAYLGPDYSDDEIERLLRWARLPYSRPDDIAAKVAGLLAENRIVGWFQGRMEFGPRALGARSILASPLDPSMQQRLNELKDREDFRPVAPVVPLEDLGNWFRPAQANGGRSPFMLFVYEVLEGQGERIPSALHSDRSARVQTVDRDSNPRFHALLRAFADITGVPVLVNTSFNMRGKPIVNSPQDAIEAFFSTPLQVLAIGSFLVCKE